MHSDQAGDLDAETAVFTEEEAALNRDLNELIRREKGVYRRQYRA